MDSVSDFIRFSRSWFANPRNVGAVAPSGARLARRMAAHIDLAREGPVIELGPGTGVVTARILERGIAPDRLILVERDQRFCDLLRRRYPDIRVVCADVRALGQVLEDVAPGRVASVVSSLPLINFDRAMREDILHTALHLLQPGAPFIQFSYAPRAPIHIAAPHIDVRFAGYVLFNIPPARVWVYCACVPPAPPCRKTPGADHPGAVGQDMPAGKAHMPQPAARHASNSGHRPGG